MADAEAPGKDVVVALDKKENEEEEEEEEDDDDDDNDDELFGRDQSTACFNRLH